MTSFLKNGPYLLIYSRLLMAVFYIFTALCKPLQDPFIISIVLISAVLTDIFDGVLARRFKVDTVHIRQLDSKVDTIFWLALFYVLIVMRHAFVKEYAVELFILILSEVALQLFGYFKFNSSLALHTYSAKVWALMIMATVLQLLLGNTPVVLFKITFIWGLISQLEVALIVFKLKQFRIDVRSFFSLK